MLAANADTRTEYDWYAFDFAQFTAPPVPVASRFTSVMPGRVRFRGMPNARWWDFETCVTDFGAIVPNTRDLAKLLFMDFMLIHGVDWFLAPLEVDAGSLCFIDSLTITDVFGVTTTITRADAPSSKDILGRVFSIACRSRSSSIDRPSSRTLWRRTNLFRICRSAAHPLAFFVFRRWPC